MGIFFFYRINTLKKRVFDCGRSCLVPVPKPYYSARALCVSCHVVRASFVLACSRICHRNALTEKAWEDAVQGLSKARHTIDLTGSKYY